MPLLSSRLLSFRSRARFPPLVARAAASCLWAARGAGPGRPPRLLFHRAALAAWPEVAVLFAELLCGRWGGGGSWGGDGAGSRLLQSWKPLLQCRQSPRRARALMPGLREPGPFCGALFRGKVLGEGSLPCAGLVPNPLPAQHSPAWPRAGREPSMWGGGCFLVPPAL